jgi:ABC-type polysaccharide/polyol phosphate export permease
MTLRPLVGQARLALRLSRVYWLMNVFSGLLLPLIVLGVFGQRMPAEGRSRLLIGSALFGAIMVVLRKAGISLTADRVFGQRELLATTGLSRESYLGGMALEAFAISLLPLGVLAAGPVLAGVPAPASWLWLPPYLLAIAAFYTLGVCLSCVSPSLPSSVLATNLAGMGFFAFCPLAYPAERVPALVRPLVAWLPPSLAAEAMAAAWAGHALSPAALVALAAWVLLFGLAGWRWFPWTDRRR